MSKFLIIGLILSCLLKNSPFAKENVRLLMFGLDNSGKTTILNRLKSNNDLMTTPTIGFNVETIDYKNQEFNIWDVGGQCAMRPLWRHYFVNDTALIFVVDSADSIRLKEAAAELHKMMEHIEMQNAVLLVFANKQDLPAAMSTKEITESLRLNELKQQWYLQPVSAVNGTGLWEGLEKLREMFKKAKI